MDSEEKLQTILVATDFSESADGAVDWAAELARPHGAQLVLLHAYLPPMPVVAAPEFVPLPPSAYEADRRRVDSELESRAAALRERGVSVEGEAVSGPTIEVILGVAERRKADLVVAGTRGLTGMKRVFLGSKAAQIVRGAPCPVLTVHPEHRGKHRPIRSILVPTDYSADAELAVRAASRLLRPISASARVKLLHVYRLQPEVVYPWTPPEIALGSGRMVEDARKRLDEIAAPLRHMGFEVDLEIQEGYPPDVIDETARRLDVDLIAMGTHGRSGVSRLVMGSVAERVLPDAPCPVLTVHEPKPA